MCTMAVALPNFQGRSPCNRRRRRFKFLISHRVLIIIIRVPPPPFRILNARTVRRAYTTQHTIRVVRVYNSNRTHGKH